MAVKQSPQAIAKAEQSWRKKADTCATCSRFTFDVEEVKSRWSSSVWTKDTNLRCTRGNFKTGKTNVCDRHEPRAAQ